MQKQPSHRAFSRQRRCLLGLVALSGLGLSACDNKPAQSGSSSSVASATAAAASAAAPFKVAFVYIGPVGDAGWTYAHDQGRRALEQHFGNKIQTSFVESVPESAADAERVFRDLANQGNQLIFGTTFGYMEAMLKVAKDFPALKFEHATGYKTAANLAQYDVRTYEGAYLLGVAAGKLSKSGKLGVVASIPIPEVLRNINAFTLGARSVNPQASTRVVWVNKWFDPGKEREAALSLIAQGVDVLMQNTDSAAVVQTAEEKGVLAFGWDSDMSKFGPRAHQAASVINWGVYYQQRVAAAMAGQWQSGTTWWGLKENMIDLGHIHADLTAELKQLLQQRKSALIDGSATIWHGPLKDNQGRVQLPENQIADDAFLHAMKFYVDGVEGKVPG